MKWTTPASLPRPREIERPFQDTRTGESVDTFARAGQNGYPWLFFAIVPIACKAERFPAARALIADSIQARQSE
jgi:hypothetical protein